MHLGQCSCSSYNDFVQDLGFSEITTGLFYIGGMALASMLLSLPFSFYSTFVIEGKFGFNKSTKATFFKDQILGIVLGVIIGGPILALILYFFE